MRINSKSEERGESNVSKPSFSPYRVRFHIPAFLPQKEGGQVLRGWEGLAGSPPASAPIKEKLYKIICLIQ
jgi:hypothetical protein